MRQEILENRAFLPVLERFIKEGRTFSVWFPDAIDDHGQAESVIAEAEELFGVEAIVVDDPQSYGKDLLLPYLEERETREDGFVHYSGKMTDELRGLLIELTIPIVTQGEFDVLFSYAIETGTERLFVEDWYHAEISETNR
ncbi:hypothetical protein [Exiguobacterium flavidum]|uniref:hypothetical protein n=1 Tax=Exiguobacterium flavidum TaxID=2184695 RepID=UPI000DF725C8|nr:hypothetical protein [Exiguobacterium flavidum]